ECALQSSNPPLGGGTHLRLAMLHRRLARDHEALPARSEAMIHLAAIDFMSRRLTGQSTPPGAAPDRTLRTKRPVRAFPVAGAGGERRFAGANPVGDAD
ncbi:hypothetical protein SMC26_22540, partial [Actinomadura fulvescens]